VSRDARIALVLFGIALWQNLAAGAATPVHPDESRWLNRAHYLRDLAAPLGPTWREGYLTRGQPPLGSYLMGVGLLLQGRDLATNGVWDFRYGDAWNAARGNAARPADLRAGRRANAVVGALTVVVVFRLGTRLGNRVGGVVGALFLALHPLMIRLGSQALADGLLVLLLALAVLAAVRLAERPSWSRGLGLGALLGLGGATKLSPLLLSLPLAALGVGLLARATAPDRSTGAAGWPGDPLGWRLAALPAVAAAVFVAVSPFLWPDPIGRTGDLFAFRVEEMGRQGTNWQAVAVSGPGDALARVGATLGERFTVSGRIASGMAGRVGAAWRPTGVDPALGLAGAALLLLRAARGGARDPHTLVAIVLGGQVALIVLGLRADFARYHLPVLLAEAVCVGVLGGELWAAGRRLPPGWWTREPRSPARATPAGTPPAWSRRHRPGSATTASRPAGVDPQRRDAGSDRTPPPARHATTVRQPGSGDTGVSWPR